MRARRVMGKCPLPPIRRAKSGGSAWKTHKYGQMGLAESVIERLRQPLMKRAESITQASASEDVSVPLLMRAPALWPQGPQKSLQYIFYDQLSHPRHPLSFLLPIVHHLFHAVPPRSAPSQGPEVLIVTPTPELVTILHDLCISLLPHRDAVSQVIACSGRGPSPHARDWKNARVAIMAPGVPTGDIHQARTLIVHYAEELVASEGTHAASQELMALRQAMAPEHSCLYFAENLTHDLVSHVQETLPDRWWINLRGAKKEGLQPVQDMEFRAIQVDEADRFECLLRLLHIHHKGKTLLFLNSVELLEDLATYLHQRDWNVEIFHSHLDGKDRKRRFGAFVQGYAEIMLCTDAILAENDIQGCSLCIQYRLPQQSLGQFLLRSWKMGGKRDPRYQCKSFLLHFEEDLPALKALRRDYHVPILSEPHPSAEDNENALLSKASQKVKQVHHSIGMHYHQSAKQLIDEVGAENALGRALFLLSRVEKPAHWTQFDLLPRSVKARLARKEKQASVEKALAQKKKRTKHLNQLRHSLEMDDFPSHLDKE